MYDEHTTEQAIEAFHNLSGDDIAKLKTINTRIQKHMGKWGEHTGGEQIAEHTFSETWVRRDPLITEFIDFAFERGFGITYVWADWNDDFAALFASDEQTKYDNVDLRTALIIIGAAVRKDRGGGGALISGFESGDLPRLIIRLVELTKEYT